MLIRRMGDEYDYLPARGKASSAAAWRLFICRTGCRSAKLQDSDCPERMHAANMLFLSSATEARVAEIPGPRPAVRLSRASEQDCHRCPCCNRKPFDSKRQLEQHLKDKHGQVVNSQRTARTSVALVVTNSLPRVEPLLQGGQEFQSLKNFFLKQWKKAAGVSHSSTGTPVIQSILKIRWKMDLEDSFREYEKLRGSSSARRLFHGTGIRRQCRLATGASQQPCTDPGCSSCGIIRHGFKISQVTPGPFDGGSHRFGPGIYMTSFSNKAHDYSHKKSQVPGLYAVFICRVVLGTIYNTKQTLTHLTGPPRGYSSVWATKGKDLNWDEVCVYHEASTKPEALLLYKLDESRRRT